MLMLLLEQANDNAALKTKHAVTLTSDLNIVSTDKPQYANVVLNCPVISLLLLPLYCYITIVITALLLYYYCCYRSIAILQLLLPLYCYITIVITALLLVQVRYSHYGHPCS